MKIGNREIGLVVSSLFQKRHYRAARNMLRVYCQPADAFGRYFLGRGRYPADIRIHTAAGELTLTAYSYHDILTVNEIFCRLDYPADEKDRVIVDFGSNIGVSAAYFLTAAPHSFAYLFEPLASNVERLRGNLRRFEGRYSVQEIAAGEADGQVEFGWEDTGRYGGIGMKTGRYVTVPCRDSNRILEEIIARHGRIDILKIDIETLERQVTERIPADLAGKIGRIYVEYAFSANPLERTHRYRQYGSVAQFVNRDATNPVSA